MGSLRTTVGIENVSRRGGIRELPDTLVDTGSEFTWIPRTVLEALAISVERRQQFIVADGSRLERDIGYAIVHAAGFATADDVVFGEAEDLVLLGVRSIEGLNLRVDVVRKQLVEAGPIIAAARLAPEPRIARSAQRYTRSRGSRRIAVADSTLKSIPVDRAPH